MIPGIDVSHYQGQIDWTQVKEHGVQFAYIKASEGAGYRDVRFLGNYRGASAAGLIPGAYHYVHPGVSAELQAAPLLSQLASVPKSGSLPVALDLEVSGITASLAADIVTRCQAMDPDLKFILYLDREMARSLKLTTPLFPLWLAEYDVGTTVLVPEPWKQYSFWQFQWGRIPGINVPCDQDWFPGTMEELKAMCHS